MVEGKQTRRDFCQILDGKEWYTSSQRRMLSATGFDFNLEQKKSHQAPGSFLSQKQLSKIIHLCEYVCCHRTEINF